VFFPPSPIKGGGREKHEETEPAPPVTPATKTGRSGCGPFGNSRSLGRAQGRACQPCLALWGFDGWQLRDLGGGHAELHVLTGNRELGRRDIDGATTEAEHSAGLHLDRFHLAIG
jgi:hypothetical protein